MKHGTTTSGLEAVWLMVEIISALSVLAYITLFLILTLRTALASGRSVWLFGKGVKQQVLPAFLFRISFVGAAVYSIVVLLADREATDPIHAAFEGPMSNLIGSVLAIAGGGLAFYSQVHMGRSWRIGAASGELGRIVQTGPFAFSRNPVFVGQVLLFAGLLLASPNFVTLSFLLVLIVAVHLQVLIEERILNEDLGDAYQIYCRKVRRWI